MLENKWKNKALCKGARISDYFPIRISKENIDVLVDIYAICEKCPVNADCLQSAILNEEIGIWGRTTLSQRQQFISTVLDNEISNVTLQKCKDFIFFLTKNNIKPNERAYKSEIID